MPFERIATRRRIVSAIKMLIVAVLLWMVRGVLEQSWNYLIEHPRTLHPEWILFSGILYLGALLPEGVFWYWALRALGQNVWLFETLSAYYIGHLGKYVPGKAMVVVLRSGLIHRQRLDTSLVIASVFLETLTMMAVGGCLAVPVLTVCFSHNPLLIAAALGTAVIGGLPTLPPVFSRLVRTLGVGRLSPAVAQKLAGFDYRTLVCGWGIIVLGWAAMGSSLWAMLRGLDFEANLPHYWLLYTAITAMAVVIGFASMIPGGWFFRDGAITLLLGPLLPGGGADALLVAVGLRFTWLLAELLISAILYVARCAAPKA